MNLQELSIADLYAAKQYAQEQVKMWRSISDADANNNKAKTQLGTWRKLLKDVDTRFEEWINDDKPSELEHLRREIEILKSWKEQALRVMPDMQAIARLMNLKPNESVHDKIIPYIQNIQDQLKNSVVIYRDQDKPNTPTHIMIDVRGLSSERKLQIVDTLQGMKVDYKTN